MKTIGLIGGMSWESTIPYYRHINETVKARLGGLHSARIVLFSVDFHEIEQLQHTGDWDRAGALLAQAAQTLERAGADFLVLCTNTMHKVATAIEAAVRIPLLHVVDPTAQAIKRAGADFLVLCTNTMHKVAPAIEAAVCIPLLHIADATAEAITHARHRRVGLLGTRFTMEQDFYRSRLQQRHGIDVLIPDESDRIEIHRIIYDELCLGVASPRSRARYRLVMAQLVERGAEAIILGCTEISLLVNEADSSVPLFDTTRLHAMGAARWALLAEETEA